jgi:hypothetical protein
MPLPRLAVLICCVLLASCQSVKVPDDKLAGEKRVAVVIRSPDQVHFVRQSLLFTNKSSADRFVPFDGCLFRAAVERAVISELATRRPTWQVVATRTIAAPMDQNLAAVLAPWVRSTGPTIVLSVASYPAWLPYTTETVNVRIGAGYGMYGEVGSIWGPFTRPYLALASVLVDPVTFQGFSDGAHRQLLKTEDENDWDIYLPHFDPDGPVPDLAPWQAEMDRLVPGMVTGLFDDLGI